MDDRNLDQAFILIDQWPQLQRFAGPQSEASIDKAESLLNLTFPPSYRRFLSKYGAGGFGSLDIYGIVNSTLDSAELPNAIWLTLQERVTAGLPHSLVILAQGDDDDAYVCLNCLQESGSTSEVPVIAYDPQGMESLADSYRIAKTFGSFLLRVVQMVIDEES